MSRGLRNRMEKESGRPSSFLLGHAHSTRSRLYHERRGNKKGAHILLNRLLKRIPLEHVQLEHLGINPSKLLIDLHIRLKNLDEPFSDYDLPLTDSHLIKLCQVRAGDRWKSQSPLNNPNIIHKHILRHQKPKIEEEE